MTHPYIICNETYGGIVMYVHKVLTLLAAYSAVSRLKWVGSIPCSCFLHCCWVSTIASFCIRRGQIWLGLSSPPPHTSPEPVPRISGSRQIPRCSVRKNYFMNKRDSGNKKVFYHALDGSWEKHRAFLTIFNYYYKNMLIDLRLLLKLLPALVDRKTWRRHLRWRR
jgi:hypothetical protein